VPAAILSSMLQASLRTQAFSGTAPGAMMATINTLACQRTATGQFATFFLASVHEPTLQMRYTNAGHNLPVLVRSNGERVLLDEGGLLVGMIDETAYQEAAVALQPGDRVLMYTDGVTEAQNAAGEMFGEDRLYALLAAAPASDDAQAIVARVLAGVRTFLDGTEAGDDITIMALRVLPPPPPGA
jgi:sigma-B regulation protein RsbU (phosphoserine phosphatase)